MKKFVLNVTAIATLGAATLLSNSAAAQSAPVACPDYKRGTTNIVGERVGKKIQKALEEYNNDLIDEALAILYEVDAKDGYDRAFTNTKILQPMSGRASKSAYFLGLTSRALPWSTQAFVDPSIQWSTGKSIPGDPA